jgi:hypothetical protein
MNSSQKFGALSAFVYFIIAYVLVTVLAATLTITYGALYELSEAAPGSSILEAPAFVATVPYHVLIMLLVWPVVAWLYFRKRRVGGPAEERRETWLLGWLWLVSAIVVDFVGFVLIKNPWSMTAYEFYVVYQPWITLIYLSIFLGPWIRLGLSRLLVRPRDDYLAR